MGVPAFYRWLTSKYPKVVLNNIENNNNNNNNSDSLSNSNLISEYDNLYIDMNGLIHPCAHPDDHPVPKNELEIYENIVKYIDRLFEAIKPKRLLFLSIDGVAPRAKMNQQRARRYRAAQEKIQRDELTSQVLNEMFPDVQLPEQTIWDSNVITPGTEFMSKLSDYLHEYIENKMKTDKEWKNIKVIFSDASVCGEGEHKIMAFIRSQRSQEGYDPNQHHVVHGLDADLIMLALATHEPKFSILREEQTPQYGRKKDKKQKQNRESIDDRNPVDWIHMKKLLCLRIEYLREYLSQEFAYLQDVLTHKYDLERIIDDFIFLCYFVGNDFLPHLPTLEIREGGIDLLLEAYKQLIQNWDDYITGIDENGLRVIHTTQLADILRKVSENETEILVQQESEARKLEDLAAQSAGTSGFTKNHKHNNNNNNRRPNRQQDPKDNEIADDNDNNGEDEEEQEQEENNDETEITDDGTNEILKIVKEEVDRRLAEIDRNAALEQRRHLRGHIHGDTPQERYYNNPFRLKDLQDGGSLERMCDSYLDGLCWVLNYYFQGPPSWGWYYPFHYAPCASDLFRNVTNRLSNQSTITYATDHSFPLKPVEQLLCVLPAESALALPLACRGLMTSKTASPLSDIYHPKDILIDRGNEMSWLWIILLPFIDVNRIIKSAKECEPHFTDEETHRNSYGSAYLYIHSSQCIDTSSHHTSPESVEESAKTEKDDLKNCLIENSSKSIYPLFGFVSSQPIEVNNDHNNDHHNKHNNHHEDSNVIIFQYFLPNESIHRSSLIDGILPLTSPLDLRFNRKKNRGGGRGWGNGSGRGKGRRRGGRGGNRKGRGESQDDNQNNDRDDDNNDDEADAVVENAEETFHHGNRDHNHNHENEHKHYDHDHNHGHDHQHDHHHH